MNKWSSNILIGCIATACRNKRDQRSLTLRNKTEITGGSLCAPSASSREEIP